MNKEELAVYMREWRANMNHGQRLRFLNVTNGYVRSINAFIHKVEGLVRKQSVMDVGKVQQTTSFHYQKVERMYGKICKLLIVHVTLLKVAGSERLAHAGRFVL